MRTRPRSSPPARGTTLLELLVVVAVAAILLAAGAPSMGVTVAAALSASQSAEFMSAVRLARSEAARRGEWVTLCARQPGIDPPACTTDVATGWQAGWLLFVDRGERGVHDPGDELVRLREPLQGATVPATLRSVTFGPGGLSVNAASHFLFRPQAFPDDRLSRLVCLAKTGRARVLPAGQVTC